MRYSIRNYIERRKLQEYKEQTKILQMLPINTIKNTVAFWLIMFIPIRKGEFNYFQPSPSYVDTVISDLVKEVSKTKPTDSYQTLNVLCRFPDCLPLQFFKMFNSTWTLWDITDGYPSLPEYGFYTQFIIVGCVYSISAILERLRSGSLARLLVIWTCLATSETDDSKIRELFSESWKSGILNVIVAVPNAREESVAVYSYYPFKDSNSCYDPSPVLLRICARNIKCLIAEEMLSESKVKNLQGCLVRVSVAQLDPYAFLIEDPDKGYRLEGLVDDLFTGLIHSMNFTPKFFPSNYGSCEQDSAVNDVSTGKTEMAIAFTLSQTPYNCSIARPAANIMTCYTWCMPAAYVKNSVWMFLVNEFTLETWCFVFVSIIAVFLFTVIFSYVKKVPLRSVADVVILGILPQPVELRVESPSLRILVVPWFVFNIILSTAYQAELHSMSVFPDTHSFRSVAELAYSSIPVTTLSKWKKFMLELDNAEPYLIHLAQRIREYESPKIFEEYEKFRAEYSSATLIPREACVYFMTSHGQNRFTFFPDYCMSTFELFPYMLNGSSPLVDTIARTNERLYQAGFNTRALPPVAPPSAQVAPPRALSLYHLYPFMIVLAGGYLLSSMVFICELFQLL